jgi:hypothetical protein
MYDPIIDNSERIETEQFSKEMVGINLSICSGSPADNIYFYTYGPVVMMAFYPNDINIKVTRAFQSYKNLAEVPKEEFEEMLESRNPVKFAYALNEELADLCHQQARRMLKHAIYP